MSYPVEIPWYEEMRQPLTNNQQRTEALSPTAHKKIEFSHKPVEQDWILPSQALR